MRILIVEDNRSHADLLSDGLTKIRDADVVRLRSEREFREAWNTIEIEPPDVALIDVMLRWDVPRLDPIPRPEGGDIYDAGIRCMRQMKESEKTAHVPIILYSVVSKPDLEHLIPKLPGGVTYMEKTSDIASVVSLIRNVTSAARSPR
jgi:CheY-like chemotaxis protein